MTNGEKFKNVFGFGADGSRVIAVNSTWWDCDFQIRKPKTNADRIRSMSNGELAQFLYESFGCSMDCPAYDTCDAQGACVEFLAKWLQQEAGE